MSAEQQQPKEVSAKDLADRLGTDAKELRKWLRSEGEGVGGKGKRYVFTAQKATQLARKYKAAQEGDADES